MKFTLDRPTPGWAYVKRGYIEDPGGGLNLFLGEPTAEDYALCPHGEAIERVEMTVRRVGKGKRDA